MRKLKLGFALEGNSDYPVIPRLTHRVISEQFPYLRLADDSIRRPRTRGHGFIRELPSFAKQLHADGVDIMIAIVDTDNRIENERLELLRQAKQRCNDAGLSLCIAEGLAVQKLEAWLLADEAAIFRVFDGDRTSVSFHSPEEDPNPKRTLNHIVRTLTAGREVTFASFAEELTEAIRLSLLRHRCSHFDKFTHNLMSCIKEWERIHFVSQC